MTYDEALKYIHGVSWTFCKPGLERISELCSALGNPQDSLKFIHVAGTNGKGSFCSMISSALTRAGLKVGVYTSPYITRFNERMRVGNECIPDSTLAELTERIKPIADAMKDKPTEFELITAIAFDYFSKEGVDVVVLECGMGGRLDSTNVIKSSVLSVITGIALDHTAFLGDTVEKIAYEKAGIIKNNTPVLYGGDDDSAAAVIEAEAIKKGSPFGRTDYKKLKVSSVTLDGSVFSYRERKDISISLLGTYQPKNASLVLDALDLIAPHFPSLTEDAIRRGLNTARWPARFEIISEDPTVIFDGAHNAQGIKSAVESIRTYFGKEKVIVITGVLSDKDYNDIAKEISGVASKVFTITPDSPRALKADEYASVLESYGVKADATPDIKSAVRSATELALSNNMSVVCLGSLYTYSDVSNAIANIKSGF